MPKRSPDVSPPAEDGSARRLIWTVAWAATAMWTITGAAVSDETVSALGKDAAEADHAANPPAARPNAPDHRNDNPTDDQTRRLIRQVFPDLPEAMLDGWVESYRDLPPEELKQLLQQRRALQDLLPSGALMSPAFSPELPSEPEHTVLRSLRSTAARNLRNALTDGYRRRLLRTQPVDVNSAAVQLQVVESGVWDLRPAPRYPTDRLFDLALPQEHRLMFRLEPGPVFTRYGRFERLPDGSLGLKTSSGRTLRLAGGVRIPRDTVELTVHSGELSIERESGQASPKQPFSVAEIIQPRLLQSENGVYFTLPDESSAAVRMVPATVISRWLEKSNVDVEQESKLLQQLEQISRISESAGGLETIDR